MKDVIAKHPKAGLMIVGGGSMHSEVERAVRDSGLADSISLAGGVPHAETLHLIAQANALLRITLFDGDAISVSEALFVGTPVIATENGMRPAGVRCISRGDKEGLVRNIEEISASRVKRPDELRPDHGNIDQVLALYDSLL